MDNFHKYYDQLNVVERLYVDRMFSYIFATAKNESITLAGDDRAEVVVDALARLIVESGVQAPRARAIATSVIRNPYTHQLTPQGLACAEDCPACLWALTP